VSYTREQRGLAIDRWHPARRHEREHPGNTLGIDEIAFARRTSPNVSINCGRFLWVERAQSIRRDQIINVIRRR
jgi:hypothetical protein